LFTLEKNPRFTAFLDSNLHTRLAIVTENELGLAFPSRNLPKKLRPDPSTFYLVIVVTNIQTNRQTDRQTNAGDYIIPRESFRGDKNPRFTAFLDSNLHTRLVIVTENELGLAFPPRNLPKKISSKSVHVLFSYRGNKQTNKQTDKPTPVIP